MHDDGSFVWVWAGEPRHATLRPTPQTPWLRDPGWVTFGGSWVTAASIRLLLDNFSDITHVAHVHPDITPPALTEGPVPPLEVTVSETGMSYARQYSPVQVPDWQAQVLELPAEQPHPQREEGEFRVSRAVGRPLARGHRRRAAHLRLHPRAHARRRDARPGTCGG